MMLDYEHELSLIRDLLKKNPEGMSVTDISKALNKNKNTIGRYLDILLISGQVDMRTYGMAKVFTLSQRVPLSAMLNYSKELIMVLDDESRIVDVNDNLLKLLNLPRAGTMGKNVAYLNPPDVDVHELLETLTSGIEEKGHAITFRLKNEGERIFTQKSVPTVFEDGKKGRTIILEDITELILAEREIQSSEERFRLMAENIQDGIIIRENETTVFVNSRIAAISGYSYDELWKMDPLSIVDPEDRPQAAEQFRKMETGHEGHGKFEMWIIRKDGERRFVYGRVTTIQDSGTRYTFITFTDITELKDKEAALLQSEQRFRTMAENIQEGLIIVENGKFVFANQRISAITGYSLDELGRMKPPDLVSKEDREKIQDLVAHTTPGSSEETCELTFWINRKNGDRRCIFGRITTIVRKGTVTSYITMNDITDTTEREKALRDRIAELQHLIG